MKTQTDSLEDTFQKDMKIQEKLNNRPRKIIGFKTPKEILDPDLKKLA